MAGTLLGSKDKVQDEVPASMELDFNVGKRLLIRVSMFQECQSMHLEFSSCRYKHNLFS